MTNIKINYSSNTSTFSDVFNHLTKCDSFFSPPLSQRINLTSYSRKIFQYSFRFEAWYDYELVALLALYLNDPKTEIAFLTNLSVLPCYSRAGIGTTLISQCVDEVKLRGFHQINLEVASSNTRLVRFYKRFGFKLSRVSTGSQNLMSISL